LYNHFYGYVIIVSLILLTSMFGSIILTVDFEYRNNPGQKFFDKRFLLKPLLYNINI
jgi:hypothetical protein